MIIVHSGSYFEREIIQIEDGCSTIFQNKIVLCLSIDIRRRLDSILHENISDEESMHIAHAIFSFRLLELRIILKLNVSIVFIFTASLLDSTRVTCV
jgi:hypothetical protein